MYIISQWGQVSTHKDEVNNKEKIYKEVEKDNVKSKKMNDMKSWRVSNDAALVNSERKEDGKAQQDDDTWHPLARHLLSEPQVTKHADLSQGLYRFSKHIPSGRIV